VFVGLLFVGPDQQRCQAMEMNQTGGKQRCWQTRNCLSFVCHRIKPTQKGFSKNQVATD
jgi:hypothetical protein